MKKQFFFSMLAAAAMMASCSSDREVADSLETTEANGYIAVTINLPTTGVTRAANDVYDDGLANEYKVDDACLVLFDGADEATATFHSAYDLNTMDKVDDVDNDDITTSYTKATKISGSISGNLYGLVLLNYKGFCVQSGTNLTIDGTSLSGKTFAQVNGLISNKAFYKSATKDYFFMTNAALCTQIGGTTGNPSTLIPANVQILARLDKSKIMDTEALAKSNPVGSIYVERAVAKATLSSVVASTDPINVHNSTAENLVVSNVAWALSNTESSSFVVRNLGASTPWWAYTSSELLSENYRFVGHVRAGTTSVQPEEDLYRTYWCIDPKYADDKTYSPLGSDPSNSAGVANPLYCYENTFDIDHQNYKNTTSAIIKCQLGDGSTFYTLNGENKLYKTLADVESYSRQYIINDSRIVSAFTTALHPSKSANLATDLTVTFARESATGLRKVTAITVNVDASEVDAGDDTKRFKAMPSIDAAVISDVIAKVNAYYQIAEYTGGVNYYEYRFMQFASNTPAEDLAPWSKTGTVNTTDLSYEHKPADYLGRYGMVRNNWYDFDITAIKHLGSPVIPNHTTIGDGDTPDDNSNEDKYIAVKINVLSWAKRLNHVTF